MKEALPAMLVLSLLELLVKNVQQERSVRMEMVATIVMLAHSR
jgi:hypothetical protein